MRTTNFDVIAASAPLDRQASVVRDGSGDLWEAKIPEDMPRWIGPPAMKSRRDMSPLGWLEMQKMVGQRFGRLTVMGIWAEGNPKKRSTWVCRCSCGYYEGRKALFLRAGHADGREICCTACTMQIHLQQRGAKANTKAARKASEALLDKIAAGAR